MISPLYAPRTTQYQIVERLRSAVVDVRDDEMVLIFLEWQREDTGEPRCLRIRAAAARVRFLADVLEQRWVS